MERFPGKLEWALLFAGATLLLTNSGVKSQEVISTPEVAATPTPVEIPVYHPFVGPLPIAQRKWCQDIILHGKRQCGEKHQ